MQGSNAVVAQSGGPSPVINSSLLGVIDACRDYPRQVGSLYAAWHGVEGILQLIVLALDRGCVIRLGSIL